MVSPQYMDLRTPPKIRVADLFLMFFALFFRFSWQVQYFAVLEVQKVQILSQAQYFVDLEVQISW